MRAQNDDDDDRRHDPPADAGPNNHEPFAESSGPSNTNDTTNKSRRKTATSRGRQRRESAAAAAAGRGAEGGAKTVKKKRPAASTAVAETAAPRRAKLTDLPPELAGLPRHRPVSFFTKTEGKIFCGDVAIGGRVLTGGRGNGALEFRHPITGHVERTLHAGGHLDAVLAVVHTPKGVVTGGSDGRLIKWSPADLAAEHTQHFEAIITALTYCERLGHVGLFSAGDESFVRQWNVEELDCIAELDGLDSCATDLASDGKYLFVAQSTGVVSIFELVDRTLLFTVNTHEGNAWCVRCDETRIFTAGDDGLIKIWSFEGLRDEMPLRVIQGHVGPVFTMFMYHNLLFSTGDDAFVVCWDVGLDADAVERVPPAPLEVLVPRVDISATAREGRTNAAQRLDCEQSGKARFLSPSGGATAATVATAAGDTSSGDGDTTARDPFRTRDDTDCSNGSGAAEGTANGPRVSMEALVAERQALGAAERSGSRWVRLSKRLTFLELEGNELCAAGIDGYVVKWAVDSLLSVKQDVLDEVPPLGGETDQELLDFQHLPIAQRHQRLQARDVKRAVPQYTELPINYVVDTLVTKVRGSWLNLELIPFVLFITLFSVFVITDFSVIDVYNGAFGVQQAIDTQSVGGFRRWETFLEIFDMRVLNQWLQASFVANMWAQQANPGPSVFSSFRFTGQNELASAVRLRTQRASTVGCSVNQRRFINAVNRTCYNLLGVYSLGQDTRPYSCADGQCTPNATTLKRLFNISGGQFLFNPHAGGLIVGRATYGPGGYVADVPGTASPSDAQAMLQALIDNGFIDSTATRLLSVEWFHYAAAQGVFFSNRLVVEMLLGSSWQARVFHTPFRVFSASSSVGHLVFEGFFAMYVLYWTVKFFTDGRRVAALCGSWKFYLLEFWTLLEFVNLALFFTTFGLRWQWYNDSIAITASLRPFDTSRYPQEFEDINTEYQLQLYLNCMNVILTFIKILKYVSLNDKLNMLTLAVSKARSSIIGVLLLFVYFVFAFALCGYAMYGNVVQNFNTLNGAYNSLLRLIVGDFDYDSLSVEAPAYTLVFHWAFLVLAVFLMLNFLIAVLVDAFAQTVDERLPVPIDEAIMRAAQVIAGELSPRSIKVHLVLWMKRSSRTTLTAEYAAKLREHRWSILSPDAQHHHDLDELQHTYLDKANFLRAAPDVLRTSDNLNFMDEVWYDLAWEYHYRLRDRTRLSSHAQELLVGEVMDAEMDHLRRFMSSSDAMIRQFNGLSRHLRHMPAYEPAPTLQQRVIDFVEDAEHRISTVARRAFSAAAGVVAAAALAATAAGPTKDSPASAAPMVAHAATPPAPASAAAVATVAAPIAAAPTPDATPAAAVTGSSDRLSPAVAGVTSPAPVERTARSVSRGRSVTPGRAPDPPSASPLGGGGGRVPPSAGPTGGVTPRQRRDGSGQLAAPPAAPSEAPAQPLAHDSSFVSAGTATTTTGGLSSYQTVSRTHSATVTPDRPNPDLATSVHGGTDALARSTGAATPQEAESKSTKDGLSSGGGGPLLPEQLPAGGGWVWDEPNDMYWSDDSEMWYHPEWRLYYHPASAMWYDPTTETWLEQAMDEPAAAKTPGNS